MRTIAYCNPFVPPEWIAAHGFRPLWLRPRAAGGQPAAAQRGVCPAAAAIVESPAALQVDPPTAIVLTTTCDQMRYAAAEMNDNGGLPVFLFHVPRTWQTAAAQLLYVDELRRLGRFLESRGGTSPGKDFLCETMRRYENARRDLLRRLAEMSAREFAAAVAEVRGGLDDRQRHLPSPASGRGAGGEGGQPPASGQWPAVDSRKVECREPCAAHPNGIPLAICGGPLLQEDDDLLELIERLGGRIVLDASESGERTLPAPIDASSLRVDPLLELVRIYFLSIPDVFRRPNDELFAWLARETARRGALGIVVRRHLWCDLWRAELPRLREECGLPLLEWESGGDAPPAVFASRIEAFMEMLSGIAGTANQ